MIRLILTGIFLLLFLGIFSPIAFLVLWLVGKWSPEKKARASMHIVRAAVHIVAFLSGIKLTVNGREKIPDGPVLYVGNHRSYFDIVIGYMIVKGECGFVAKKELDKIPSLRVWMRFIHCLFLDRQNLREGMKTINEAIENVKSGISMWIFPEGTRNDGEVPMEFKEGSLRIAEKSGCPVVPIAMQGTAEIFEKHVPWIKSTEVVVTVCDPIFLDGLDRKEKKTLGAKSRAEIMAVLPEEYQDPAATEA